MTLCERYKNCIKYNSAICDNPAYYIRCNFLEEYYNKISKLERKVREQESMKEEIKKLSS